MSGGPSLSGLRYDPGTYRVALAQSVGPGSYTLGTPMPHCQPCLPDDARVVHGKGGGVALCADAAQVDVESELRSLTRRATLNPAGKYNPDAPGSRCTAARMPFNCLSRGGVPVEDTRLSNPPSTLRETGWNRWEWLCEDPQTRAVTPFQTSVDTVLVAKDNHRPMLHRPLDNTRLLPPGNTEPSACEGGPDFTAHLPMDSAGNLLPEDALPELHWRSCADIKSRGPVPGTVF